LSPKKLKQLLKPVQENQLDFGSELDSLDSEGIFFIDFRSKVQQNTNQSILRIEGVNDRTAA
jgi:hypothetical protein